MSSRKHPFLSALAAIFAIVAVVGCVARALPVDFQSLPYVPFIIALSPWFGVLAAIAFILALISRRWFIALVSLACVGVQVYWQLPYYQNGPALSTAAVNAVSNGTQPDTDDAYARVMTCNVYKGRANAQQIVDTVRDNHIEVLALQETTADFLKRLDQAGISKYLPYSITTSSVYGNGLWSAQPMTDPAETEFNSSASQMPSATITFDHGNLSIRFVSVHTKSPDPESWVKWDKTLQEMQEITRNTNAQYVLMGDFNSTTDHAVFRNILGSRFQDAAQSSGHGLVFTWIADNAYVPPFSGIDHIVTEHGVIAGQVHTVKIEGSDHRALLATLEFPAQ